MFGYVICHFGGILEHIMIEQLPPEIPFFAWQIPDGENCVVKGLLWLTQERGRIAPPIIHQNIERGEALDMMPPHRGDVDCIAGFKFDDLSMS